MPGTLKWLKYFLPVTSEYPIYLIFFVTSQCMGKCRHCFYWQSLNREENALSLDEIEKLSASAGPLLQLTLTGGEPLLRDDLAEVIKIFHRHNQPYNIGLATSGYQPERLERLMKEVLPATPDSNFTVGLPIEGPPELNDEIRGIPGFYARTEASIRMLKDLKKEWPKLSVLVDITASHFNQERLAETYMLVRDQFKPDLINLIITRGEPREAEAGQIDPNIIGQVTALMEEDVRAGKIPGYKFHGKILGAKDVLLRRVALSIFAGGKNRMRCRAGDLIGVLYPEGEVYPCELWKEPMGRLRDCGYDLKKLWNSKPAQKIREEIRAKNCVCHHQCFLSPSLFFDPLYLPSLAGEMLKTGRRR